MRYFISAGEASGDLHAAELMAAIKDLDPKARFVFLGGDNMSRQAGHEPVIHISQMAFMGFSQVIKNLGKVMDNIKQARHALRLSHAHALILVDYPDFNLKLAKEATTLGIPVFYYISPKVWAWKEWRVAKMKRLIDRMYVIFPFEVNFFRTRHQWKVKYVGNPSVGEIDKALTQIPPREEFTKALGLNPQRHIIALLPGSRHGEINNNLPVMLQAAAQFPQYRPVIAGAPAIEPEIYNTLAPGIPVVYNNSVALLAHSQGAMVTSGTATLEAALVGTPQVACYRANGSKISYAIMEKLLKVPFVTLPNLIAGRQVIPELLVHQCTPDAVAAQLGQLLGNNAPARLEMLEGYRQIRRILGTENAAKNTAESIMRHLKA